jgi:hypothetical protein
MIEDVDRSQSYPGVPVIHVRMRVSVPVGLLCVRVCARLCVCVGVAYVRESHSVSACVLSFRAFGLVSVSFAFRFRACVLSEVEILWPPRLGRRTLHRRYKQSCHSSEVL